MRINLSFTDEGFVLPYVLVTIAVMSIFMSMVAVRLMDVSSSARVFAADANADIALASVEAEAVFALMTAIPNDDGLLIPPAQGVASGASGILIGGAGGRLASNSVPGAYIEFQDITGLIPLNGLDANLVSLYLRANGFGTENARSLAAKLVDYTDEDSGRMFRGSERADYRMRGLNPPSNRPLRHHNELFEVLGWTDAIHEIGFWTLVDQTSVHTQVVYFNPTFIPDSLRRTLEAGLLGSDERNMTGLSSELLVGNRTTNSWRVKLYVPVGPDKVRIRALDVERRLSALNEPFTTNLVYERVVRKESGDLSDYQ